MQKEVKKIGGNKKKKNTVIKIKLYTKRLQEWPVVW